MIAADSTITKIHIVNVRNITDIIDAPAMFLTFVLWVCEHMLQVAVITHNIWSHSITKHDEIIILKGILRLV